MAYSGDPAAPLAWASPQDANPLPSSPARARPGHGTLQIPLPLRPLPAQLPFGR